MRQEGVRTIGKNAIIALGGNVTSHVGDARATVMKALAALDIAFDGLTASDLYETPAFPAGSGPNFINAACLVHTHLDPQAVLAMLHALELDFGRTRDRRWGQRTLDLDLIAFDDCVLPDAATQSHWRDLPLTAQITQTPDTLILPHPRIQDRSFVLVPMCDVAPDWVHPLLGLSSVEMLALRPQDEHAEIKALAP